MDIIKGKVLKIKGKQLVVVHTEQETSQDRMRGDWYSAFHFTTISKEDFEVGKPNPKEKKWTVSDMSSMHGANEILKKDIEIIDSVKIKEEVVKVYKPK